jgi:mannose-6-phosphate isomerase-like protein (cupin superfamily)
MDHSRREDFSMIEGRLIRLSDLQPTCPPDHKDTHSYEIISRNTVGAKHIEILLSEVQPGGEAEENIHLSSEHAYFMISGVGEAKVEGKTFTLHPEDCLFIPPGAKHSIRPIGGQGIRLIVVFAPPKE